MRAAASSHHPTVPEVRAGVPETKDGLWGEHPGIVLSYQICSRLGSELAVQEASGFDILDACRQA